MQQPSNADFGERLWIAIGTVAFLALSLQTVTATGHVTEYRADSAIKLYHVLFAALVVLVLARGALVRWRGEALLYFVVVLLSGGVAAFAFGANPMIANYVFAAYTMVIGACLGQRLGNARAVTILRIGTGAMLLAVVAKAILYAPVFLEFFAAPSGHPILPFFYGGGANLEATWIALGAVFFVGTRLFYPYCLGSLGISLLYASRGSVVFLAMAMGGHWLRTLVGIRTTNFQRAGIAASMLAILMGIAVAGMQLQHVPGVSYVIQRFSAIGSDPGSVGRFTLWRAGVQVFQHYPFGVGQGNAMRAVERELGASVPEDNLHNVFLQHAVDTGIQGFLVYTLFCVVVGRRIARDRLRSPLLLYMGIYLLAGAIQFRGVDAIFWFIYGMDMGSDSGSRSQGDHTLVPATSNRAVA